MFLKQNYFTEISVEKIKILNFICYYLCTNPILGEYFNKPSISNCCSTGKEGPSFGNNFVVQPCTFIEVNFGKV